jgi:hypothetical protein
MRHAGKASGYLRFAASDSQGYTLENVRKAPPGGHADVHLLQMPPAGRDQSSAALRRRRDTSRVRTQLRQLRRLRCRPAALLRVRSSPVIQYESMAVGELTRQGDFRGMNAH